MKLIPIHGGRFAQVDDDDFEKLSRLRWHLMQGVNTVYAATNVRRPNGGYSTVSMHRMINETPVGFFTDHKDGDGLNNTRANLRTATAAQNGANRMPNRCGSSTAKGVYWNKNRRRWIAAIRVNGKAVFLGRYKAEADAAAAYARAAEEHFGAFARVSNGEKS